MVIDISEESNGSMPSTNEDISPHRIVLPERSGEGLPYAPENWPNPGDTWTWRVGKRVATTGHYLDRYLYLPKRLHIDARKKNGFASKLAVERYLRTTFPGADIDAFFASFTWRIPASKSALTNGYVRGHGSCTTPIEEIAEYDVSDSQTDVGGCKAGNKMCRSILEQVDNRPLEAMPCDLCCSEPRFCYFCCCILCSQTINRDNGDCSYIKCEAVAEDGYVCGHIAHIDCALLCNMAGTVGGSIGLDAEYYCRRCDGRTDLVSHAAKLFQTCESIDSRDDLQKILRVGVCILRGSEKAAAKWLLNRFELAIAKLKCGTSLEDICKFEDNTSTKSIGCFNDEHAALVVTNEQDRLDIRTSSERFLSTTFDPKLGSLELEHEIDQVLLALKKSQESEYKIAAEGLYAQKDYLHNLYQQLEREKCELEHPKSSPDSNVLLDAVLSRVNQIKRELMKLKDMEKVANGFGKTPKGILKEHFGLEYEN